MKRIVSTFLFALLGAEFAVAASHREAPLIALDPAADTTDVYAFVSYDAANLALAPAHRKVTFIVNVIPGQDPADGPNYFNFDDEVVYRVNIDHMARPKTSYMNSASRPKTGPSTRRAA